MQTTQVADFRKHVEPGKVKAWTGSGTEVLAPVFATIEWKGGRLSITGVIGPKANGDALGSCGQIVGESLEGIELAPDWTPETYARFVETWERWHLNDMRAGCEHQRANWGDPTERVEVVSYKLTTEAYTLRLKTIAAASRAALAGEEFRPDPAARALAEMDDWYKARHQPPDSDSPLSGLYEVEKRKMKPRGWVYERENPRGILAKPCEVCGYKYGTAWLREEVPADVLEFLQGLPANHTPIPTRWMR
jgi:hypothetical protein